MTLYIRDKSQCVNFVHTVKELRDFVGDYIYGTQVVLGDLSIFTGPMRSMLLKFLEDNPMVDCYSSEDLSDAVLLSRFSRVVKTPLSVSCSHSEEEFKKSDRSYGAALQYLEVSNSTRLLCCRCSDMDLSFLMYRRGSHE